MQTDTTEMNILERAIAAFRVAACNERNGLGIKVEAIEPEDAAGYRYDTRLRLERDGIAEKFIAEVKKHLTTTTLGTAINQMEHFPQQGLLVTDYVNPNMADRLKEMNIPFLDTAGNAYFNTQFVYIFSKGNKPTEPLVKADKARAFQPTGLKVIFALLCQPALVNAPYRDIATAAGVALGTVGWVMTDLKTQGYVVDMGKRGRRLTNRERLLERWVTVWPEQLRPKLLTGRYTIPDTGIWIDTVIEDYEAYWGGEVAAAMLTNYLKPETLTIYTKGNDAVLQLEMHMRKDPEGNVELLKTFWGEGCEQIDEGVVPALLVYADLLATGDPRNIETAKLIHGQHLDQYLRED